jgi:hypothetical protein
LYVSCFLHYCVVMLIILLRFFVRLKHVSNFVCIVFVILFYCVCNFVCCVFVWECVCVILCFLCIVVPLPPGTYPLAVSSSSSSSSSSNNNTKTCTSAHASRRKRQSNSEVHKPLQSYGNKYKFLTSGKTNFVSFKLSFKIFSALRVLSGWWADSLDFNKMAWRPQKITQWVSEVFFNKRY